MTKSLSNEKARSSADTPEQATERAAVSRQSTNSGTYSTIQHPEGQIEVLTPLKAVRAKCLDCCCGSHQEVRLCPAQNCALWPYRMGKRPSTLAKPETTEKREVAPCFSAQNEK